jgi:hypothetical protein
LPGLALGPHALGVQQSKLHDLALLAVLADVGGAVDREVRHQRRDEVGLAGARSGLVEEFDEPAAGHLLAAVAGLAVDVDREA